MNRRTLLGALVVTLPGSVLVHTAAAAQAPSSPSLAERRESLLASERAFAKTMSDRDHAAFAGFVAEEGVFFGSARAMHGRTEVAAGWKRFFEGPKAPFSWEPDRGEVLGSGTLGMTSGPVRDPDGKRIGTFNTTWRYEADGKWRVVFDIGCPPCECK